MTLKLVEVGVVDELEQVIGDETQLEPRPACTSSMFSMMDDGTRIGSRSSMRRSCCWGGAVQRRADGDVQTSAGISPTGSGVVVTAGASSSLRGVGAGVGEASESSRGILVMDDGWRQGSGVPSGPAAKGASTALAASGLTCASLGSRNSMGRAP